MISNTQNNWSIDNNTNYNNTQKKQEEKGQSNSNLSKLILKQLQDNNKSFDIASYLNEDISEVENSIFILLPILLNSFYKKCIHSNNHLSILINEISRFNNALEQFKNSKIILLRELDFRTDHGYQTLSIFYGLNLNAEFQNLSSKSKLKDESDFTLITILSSYILETANQFLKDEFSAYDLLSIIKDAPIEIEKNITEENNNSKVIQINKRNIEIESKDEQSTLQYYFLISLVIVLALTIVALIYYIVTSGVSNSL